MPVVRTLNDQIGLKHAPQQIEVEPSGHVNQARSDQVLVPGEAAFLGRKVGAAASGSLASGVKAGRPFHRAVLIANPNDAP